MKMTQSFASTFPMPQISKTTLLDSCKIVLCTLFLPDFCLVFETGSGMKLTVMEDGTMEKFPRYTVPGKRGRHRHGRCSHPLVASASG